MIWLGAYGNLGNSPLLPPTNPPPPPPPKLISPTPPGPIGSPSDGGSASPIGTLVSSGITFALYSGTNSDTGSTVYTFIVSDGSLKNDYSGDLLPFFTYLEKFESGLGGMLVQSVQAGTEAVTGKATFETSGFSIGYT